MFLNSINIQDVYNFNELGTPELSDLNQFNLFIGKNGSGKSNILRTICNLDADTIYSHTMKYHELKMHIQRNNIHHHAPPLHPYMEGCNINLYFDKESIAFKDGIHKYGDFTKYSGHYLELYTEHNFQQQIDILDENNFKTAVLSFVISYVFELDIELGTSGSEKNYFIETFSKNDSTGRVGTPIHSYNCWSSGFLAVSNLLLSFLSSQKSIICFDEPEVHLEPRILRRVFSILMWLCIDGFVGITKNINTEWKEWLYSRHFGNRSIWKDKDGVIDFPKKQLFITSHSSVLINEFLNHNDLCNIYEFNRSFQYSKFSSEGARTKLEIKSLVANVKKVNIYPQSILDNLGVKGSDILQANGIIWVEGPSDVIYIKKWLEMYARENRLALYNQGYHYEFQMYGGTLLDSLCLIKDGLEEENILKKLVEIFSFSRNAFLVTDSDAIVNADGKIVDKSKFREAKEFMKIEFDRLKEEGFNLDMWYKQNNTDIRTLENYLDDETLSNINMKSYTKKIFANKCVEYWAETKSISEFNYSLENEIEILYELIGKWNEV